MVFSCIQIRLKQFKNRSVKGTCQQGGERAAGWRKYLREAGRVGAAASGDAGEEGWVPAGQDVLVSPAPGCGRMASDPTEPLGLAGVGSPCVCVCVCVACRPQLWLQRFTTHDSNLLS